MVVEEGEEETHGNVVVCVKNNLKGIRHAIYIKRRRDCNLMVSHRLPPVLQTIKKSNDRFGVISISVRDHCPDEGRKKLRISEKKFTSSLNHCIVPGKKEEGKIVNACRKAEGERERERETEREREREIDR